MRTDPRLRGREPEGRRRQDDDRGQPQRVPRRGGRARAADRSRPAGERDLRARDACERRLDARLCSTARRSRTLAKPSSVANLDVVMAKSDLAAAAVELVEPRRRRALPRGRARRERSTAYSYVLLDCPPSFGPLTVNALAAANRAIVPVQAEYYALEGLSQLLGTINLVKAQLNPQLAVAGILLTMADGRTRLSAEVEAELRRHFGSLVFTTTIPRSVRLAEAPSHGVPAIAYDRRSAGARGLLEGGDGACRAFLRSDAVSGEDSRSCSARPASPSSCTSRSRRSTRIRDSRAAASSRRRRPGSRARSDCRASCSPSSSAVAPRADSSSSPASAAGALRVICRRRHAPRCRPRRRRPRLAAARAGRERRPRAALPRRRGSCLRVARRRVRAVARRRRGARRDARSRRSPTACVCSSSRRRCCGCSPAET